MGKKQFLKDNKKKSKHAPQVPATADEYLAAGVDFEEAGEKWRGGDAAKSTRFFTRALDNYEEALKKFPNSFDLAYNKARVMYELTQYPKLRAELPGTLLELLAAALEASRYALGLKQDNADILFNTAQVLTSIAEATSETRNVGNDDNLALLEEAIELFQRCLTLQEYQYTESQDQAKAVPTSDSDPDYEGGGVPLSNNESQPAESELPQEDQWASIVEPVTFDTLLDTLVAQLQTLTILCGLVNVDAGRGLAWIEEYSTPLIGQKLQGYLPGTTNREQEAGLAKSNLVAALADANFRVNRIDIGTYERILNDAYSSLSLDDHPEGLCDKAEAFISYNSSLRLNYEAAQSLEATASRWKVLTAAIDNLTKASKLPSADNLPKIHILRGDVELLRFQLGQPPSNYGIALANQAALTKNAEKFYRGAGNFAKLEGLSKELEEALVKEALAISFNGEGDKLLKCVKVQPESVRGVLEDAIDDGLVSYETLSAIGIA